MIAAWEATSAFADATLHWVVDSDDPTFRGYFDALVDARPGVEWSAAPFWLPLVPKLNGTALDLCTEDVEALGFAGDDHIPRTPGWARHYLDTLRDLGTGIVYCDDGYQRKTLPTQWAMTVDIVRELRAMVPAPVEHLYCDNAVMDLGVAAGCLTYLPDVLIEHMHPVVRKAPTDPQYQRVNSRRQYQLDRPAYSAWRTADLPAQAEAIRRLRAGR